MTSLEKFTPLPLPLPFFAPSSTREIYSHSNIFDGTSRVIRGISTRSEWACLPPYFCWCISSSTDSIRVIDSFAIFLSSGAPSLRRAISPVTARISPTLPRAHAACTFTFSLRSFKRPIKGNVALTSEISPSAHAALDLTITASSSRSSIKGITDFLDLSSPRVYIISLRSIVVLILSILIRPSTSPTFFIPAG